MNSSTLDARQDRAESLAALDFNGMNHAILQLLPDVLAPTTAELEVFFFNDKHLADFKQANFSVSGGRRVVAGSGMGQVSVRSVTPILANKSIVLTIAPIGDYSAYTLTLDHGNVDPIFQDLEFKFRPGCFSIDCSPDWDAAPQPQPLPGIDYMAKDFESFRHTLHNAMSQRVPGWQPSSRADLDETLIDLIAAAGDELSDFQDRVMNEAYLVTCRNRVSLARHSRLMDYHVHQGCQASTWLALEVNQVQTLTANELQVRTGTRTQVSGQTITFATRETHLPAAQHTRFDPRFNTLKLHTWSNAKPSLRAGATSADIIVLPADAADLEQRIVGRPLLIQEYRNPATGAEAGRSLAKRQVLTITKAKAMTDTVAGVTFLRLSWDAVDALQRDYCFTAFCPGSPVTDCALFHGNLIRVHHGAVVEVKYREPGTFWAPTEVDSGRGVAPIKRFRYYERTQRHGTLCRLPYELGALAYLDTLPDGITAPESSIRQLAVNAEFWTEVISLVHSDDTADQGRHFAVETNERQRSVLRFGNGSNGNQVPTNAIIAFSYQLGGSHTGNVGADALVQPFESDTNLKPAWIDRAWNPLDVINGRDPEPASRVLRNAPEAFRARQLRAVTLTDYVERAQHVPGVSRAVASYAWTGSWRTVRIALDPKVGTAWDDVLSVASQQLNAVRLIGEDLELRPPVFVPLEITMDVCLRDEVWPQDVRFVLEQEFSTGWTPDGRMAFFHPDAWTFGQSLHRSQMEGRLLLVQGVEHMLRIHVKRFNDRAAKPTLLEELTPRFNEIFEVLNNADSREHGYITFNLSGGRL